MSYIPSDKYPFCVLNVEIDPSQVDVNVHPAKLEVKFSNENIIFSAVYYAVRTALSTSITRPELYQQEEKRDATPISKMQFPIRDREAEKPEKIVFDSNSNFGVVKQNSTLEYTSVPKEEPKKEEQRAPINPFDNADGNKTEQEKTSKTPIVQRPSFIRQEEKKEKIIVPDYRIIGEAFNSYVIAELGETMYLIDKHAAHERIIFEDLKKITKSASPSSQMLLMPIEAYFTSDEIATLLEWEEDVRKTGFNFEANGSVVKIYEIPTGIEQNAAADMLITFASRLIRGEGDAQKTKDEFFEQALYQASCKAAIKAGRIYAPEHVKWICDRVFTLDNIKYCPHGRPVAFEITKHFLEKQFERIK